MYRTHAVSLAISTWSHTLVEGTGVRLTPVRFILEGHGVRIWAESPGLDVGASFRFVLSDAEDEISGDEQHSDGVEP